MKHPGRDSNPDNESPETGPVEGQPNHLDRFIGESAAARQVKRFIEKAAPHPCRVLVTGPSGTGKNLVAGIIHALGERPGRPFIEFNCASIPEESCGRLLFGAAKDASEGITSRIRGKSKPLTGGRFSSMKSVTCPCRCSAGCWDFWSGGGSNRPSAKTRFRSMSECCRPPAKTCPI